MSSKVIEIYRKNLRHEIIKRFPTFSSREIYAALKSPNLPDLFFENLFPICESIEIPTSSLPNIFIPYRIFSNRISEERFINFLEDEVTCKSIPNKLPPNITDEQIAILSKLANAIRTHRTQATPSKKAGLCSERPSYSQQWIYLTRLNYNKGENAKVRLSSLLHFAAEMNLSFSPEKLLDAIFTFFEKKFDSINFEQFTHLMETF